MTPRSFLVRGLAAGLAAGLLAFFVAYQVGEPHVEAAIALEAGADPDTPAGAAADAPGHAHPDGTAPHSHGDSHVDSHGDGDAVVSRFAQRTGGLLTGTVVVGTALGGLVALLAAAAMGRLGRLSPAQSTALVTGVGFVAVALVPFLKYPAAPPAVGNAETIVERTWLYFGFLGLSVSAAGAAVLLGRRLLPRHGPYAAVVGALGCYLAVVVAAAVLMPAVDELGSFPADVLWGFRLSSLFTLGTLWGVLGVALTGLVGRLHSREQAALARRELAASL